MALHLGGEVGDRKKGDREGGGQRLMEGKESRGNKKACKGEEHLENERS